MTNKGPNSAILVVLLVLCLAAVTIMTLMFAPEQVTKGYALNSLENEYRDLSREMEEKDMQVSLAKSLKLVEASPKVQRMVKPAQIGFIDGTTAIASK